MFVSLDRNEDTPIYEQLYKQIKDKILMHEIGAEEKLPSKRQLKDDLGISMTTIEHAYTMLIDEGLIYSKDKSGYYIETIEGLKFEEKNPEIIERPSEKVRRLPLGTIDTSIIQADTFRQIAQEVYRDASLFNKGEDSGEEILKQNIYEYMHNNRGVTCSIDQIVIGPSTEFLLDQLMHLLDYESFSIEDPGYPVVKKVLNKHGMTFKPVPVTQTGIDVDQVSEKIVHVTPSHQFPTGAILNLQKRVQLLQHVNSNNGYIIEDDYDSEFRYDGHPLPSLHSLDQHDRTIYMTTFSKVLFPSLRLACMVLPKSLAERYYQEKFTCDVPRHLQHVVAHYFERGFIVRHINRMRKIYRERTREITGFLSEKYPEVEVRGMHTGMHIWLRVPGENIEARARAFDLSPLNDYAIDKSYSDSIVIGIGESTVEEVKEILSEFFQ